MDFTFSPEQEELRRSARAFLEREVPPSKVRELFDGDACGNELWSRMSDLGWTGVLGGDAPALLDAVVLAEEMGAKPLPGPWLSSAVAGVSMATRLNDHAALDDLVSGRRRATVALEEGGHRDPLQSVATTAERRGLRWVLDGLKPFVIDGDTADLVYVVALDPYGLGVYAVEDPRGEPVPTLDVTRRVARLELRGRPARRVGFADDQSDTIARVIDDIGIALCAESVGACDRALQMATDHAKARVQFDRPIASFQVIRHKLVDMLHQLELARVATHYAAWASDTDDAGREHAAAMAKGFVAEAAVMITGENIQVHGGVGFTWDVDCHLLFRRVKANDVLFGRQAWQRQRLADLVIPSVSDAV